MLFVPGSQSLRDKAARVDRLFGEIDAARQIPADARARDAFLQGRQPLTRASAATVRQQDKERRQQAADALRTEIGF